MGVRSAVKRLPDEVRADLEQRLKDFLKGELTLDQVMSWLEGYAALVGVDPEAVPSRSSVHRYAQNFESVVQRIQRSRELTDLLSEQLGPAVQDGRGVQVLIQAVQGLTYDLLATIDEGTALDPKAIRDLAQAAQLMASAQKTDADRSMKIEAEVRRKAAADVQKLGKKLGWSAETARTVREEILGVKLGAPPSEPASDG